MREHAIFSKLDLEAQKSFDAYRSAIGIDPELLSRPSPKTIQLGQWLSGLVLWDLFVTATFRPIIRRRSNARGFAYREQVDSDPRRISFRHCPRKPGLSMTAPRVGQRDFEDRLVSRSPSEPYVRGFFDRFLGTLETTLQCHVDHFVGFEAGRMSGSNHFHALLTGDGLGDFSRKEIWEWLFEHAGMSRVLPYQPEKGAAWYLSATYVGKKSLGWDIGVGNRRFIRPRRIRGGCADPVISSANLPRVFYNLSLPRWHR